MNGYITFDQLAMGVIILFVAIGYITFSLCSKRGYRDMKQQYDNKDSEVNKVMGKK